MKRRRHIFLFSLVAFSLPAISTAHETAPEQNNEAHDEEYDENYDENYDAYPDESVEASADFFEEPIEWRFSTGLMSVNGGVNAELEFCGTGKVMFTCMGVQAMGTNEVLDMTLQVGVQFGSDNLRLYLSPGVSFLPAAGFIIDAFAVMGGEYPPFDFYYPSAQLFGEAEIWWRGMTTNHYTLWVGAGASYHISEFDIYRMPLGAAANMKVGLSF